MNDFLKNQSKGNFKGKCVYVLMLIKQINADVHDRLKQDFDNFDVEESFHFYERLILELKELRNNKGKDTGPHYPSDYPSEDNDLDKVKRDPVVNSTKKKEEKTVKKKSVKNEKEKTEEDEKKSTKKVAKKASKKTAKKVAKKTTKTASKKTAKKVTKAKKKTKKKTKKKKS